MTIKLNSLSKTYDNGFVALNDVTVEIQEHEFIVVVGPSGCGKTTLLRLLLGLETITSGSIEVNGLCINDVLPSERNMSIVFQQPNLYPMMTVYENIAFGLKRKKLSKEEIRKRVNDAATIVQITEYLSSYPSELSGGQQQRVSIARAITHQPSIYLMDEPFSNLDNSLRLSLLQEIKRIHKQLNATFIYVTHDYVEATSLATKIIVMNEGRIQQVDTFKNCYMFPETVFVARFLGNGVLNEIECVVTEKDGRFVCQCHNTDFYVDQQQYVLQAYIHTTVIVAIRPEDFTISEKGSIEGVVIENNYVGCNSQLVVETTLGSMVVKGDVSVGETIYLTPSRVYLFDSSGRKI